MSFPKRLPPLAANDPPGAVYTSPAPGGAPFGPVCSPEVLASAARVKRFFMDVPEPEEPDYDPDYGF